MESRPSEKTKPIEARIEQANREAAERPQLWRFELSDDVVVFSTTRHGGVSTGAYSSFNINPYCGDEPEATYINKVRLAESLGIPDDRIVMPHQVHGTAMHTVTQRDLDMPAAERGEVLEGIDAVLTQCRGVCIGVSTADCIPVVLYDPRHHASAAIHAGWRGTLQRIAGKAVAEMQQTFATQPGDIKALIGPGISEKRFEVGDEVYEAFAQAGHDMQRIAVKHDKWHIDLPLSNRLQLEAAGVPARSILMSGICTYDRVDDFFSARRLGTASGRIYTGILIK